MISTIHLCQHVSSMLHIPVRIYEKDGTPVDMKYAEDNQEDPLVRDPDFRAALLNSRKEDEPVIFYEANCVMYAVIPANGDRTVVAGPSCYVTNTHSESRAVALLHYLEDPDHYIINFVSAEMMAEAVLLIFHSHSDTELSVRSLLMESRPTEYTSEARADAYSIIYRNRENQTSHNSYAQEVREQKAIREGNIEALRQSWSEVQVGRIGRLGRDEITHHRNLAIVVITLASRSAIEGGLLPEVAYSISDSYIMRINEMNDPVEIDKLMRSTEIHYAELVREARESTNGNPYVRRCKELIHDRLHERVYEEDLAEELGITRSYLSQLFLKEEGIHLTEFILRQKVKASEYLLIYPDIPLGRIAATFGFSSQSHYGQVFKKYNGISPGKYREKHLAHKE